MPSHFSRSSADMTGTQPDEGRERNGQHPAEVWGFHDRDLTSDRLVRQGCRFSPPPPKKKCATTGNLLPRFLIYSGMKTMKLKTAALRASILVLAAGVSLGMSSCSTTTGNFDSRKQNVRPVGAVGGRIADTALMGVAIPLRTVGWLMVQPFADAAEILDY